MVSTIYFGSVRWLVAMPQFDGSQPCTAVDDFGYPEEDISPGLAIAVNNMFKRICEGCPFINECLEYALAHETHGVWGGTTPHERDGMRRKIGLTVTSPDEIHTVFYRRRNVNTTQPKKEETHGLSIVDDFISDDVLIHPFDRDVNNVHVA